MADSIDIRVEGVKETVSRLKLHEQEVRKQCKKAIYNSARAVKYNAKHNMPVAKQTARSGKMPKRRRNRSGKMGIVPIGQTKKSLSMKKFDLGLRYLVVPKRRNDIFSQKNGWKRHWIEFGKGHGKGKSKKIDILGRKVGYVKPRPVMANAEKEEKPKFLKRMDKIFVKGVKKV